MGLLSKILGDPNKKIIEDLQRIVNEINDSESKFEKMSDDQLKNYSNIRNIIIRIIRLIQTNE